MADRTPEESSDTEGVAARAEVRTELSRLQAHRDLSDLLSGYVAVLTDDAGWGVQALADMLGVSRQSISNRRRQGRELRADLGTELAALPAPSGRATGVARTRSGLRVPDVEAISARETAWVEQECGVQLSERAQIPAALRLLAGVIEDAGTTMSRLRDLRGSLAWSLTCYDAKARQGLQRAGCWQPDEFFAARAAALGPAARLREMGEVQLRELAVACGVAEVSDLDQAREQYFSVSSQLVAAQSRRRAAVGARDALVRRYVQRDAGGRWKGVVEVAGWIGRNQAQVTQICDQG